MSDGHDGFDERFDAFLEQEAPEYNRPPATVPREEMWDVVARARAAARSGTPRSGGSATHAPSRRPLRYAPWIGMAATLVIGIGVGRYLQQRDPLGGDPARAVAGVDSAAQPVAQESAPASITALTSVPTPLASRDAAAPGVVPVRQVATTQPSRAPLPVAPSARGEARLATSGTGYSVASREHLARAEALVAVVSTMPADAMMDSLMGRWARDVLTNTRLLLDSPAGADPIRRRLLEDLETLLVQLIQRSGRTVEERDMIDRTLQRTQLLTRLRSGATGT